MSCRVLVVDDEESIRYTFEAFLKTAGYEVATAESLEKAIPLVHSRDIDVLFLDILLGRASGIQLLKESREVDPNRPVVMVTGAPEISTAAEAVRLGAFDYITKPVHQDELLRLAARASEHRVMLQRQEQYQQRLAAVFEGVSEGLLVFDEHGCLAEINDSACRMLRCSEKVVGLNLAELVQDSGCKVLAAFRELLESRFEGELYRIELVNDIGQPLSLSLTMSPLTTAAGKENGVVLVLRDEAVPNRQLSL